MIKLTKTITSFLAFSFSLTISSAVLAEEPVLAKEYVLPSFPEGKILHNKEQEEIGILFSKEEYRDIAHMYNDLTLFYKNNNLWYKMHTINLEIQRVQHDRLVLCIETRDMLEITAEDMYSLWQEEHDLRLSLKQKEKKRKIFIGLGAGAIGIILGVGITTLLAFH